jgi:beta-galactosidase
LQTSYPTKPIRAKLGLGLDVLGVNYHVPVVRKVKTNFPGKKLIFMEQTSAFQTRRYYQMPSNKIWTGRANTMNLASLYDHMHARWGNSYEELWEVAENSDYVSGFFMWTEFDYLSEPTPYTWPSRSSYYRIIDLAGLPKDVYYIFQSELTNKTVLHIFPHWTLLKDGQHIDVWADYNNADEIELFLNIVSQGRKSKPKMYSM